MASHKYTDQLATMKPVCGNEKLCWNKAQCIYKWIHKNIDWYKFVCWMKNLDNTWIWIEITRLFK